jgi:hypothetical protein
MREAQQHLVHVYTVVYPFFFFSFTNVYFQLQFEKPLRNVFQRKITTVGALPTLWTLRQKRNGP